MASSPAHIARAEMLRRTLLGLVTALLVARPLVLGEDPGFLTRNTSGTSLFLSVLWLVAGLGTSVWCLWSREGSFRLGGVLLGLGVLVVCIVHSALTAAHYRHPAILIAWEWLVLLVEFFVLRQLLRSEDDVRCLLAAILASAVSLAAFALYQYFVELPSLRAAYADPEALRQVLGIDRPDDPYLQLMFKRIQENNAFGTYAHPNSFAGFLTLFAPLGLGWCIAGYRALATTKYSWTCAACFVVLLLGLWFTHSRGAIMGLCLACAAWLTLAAGPRIRQFRIRILGAAGLLFLLILMMSMTSWGSWVLERAIRSFGLRVDYWTATWQMIRDHLWSGVGPGNFGRLYPRYMVATAFERIQDPHNLLLEIWATSGLFAALALALVVGFYLLEQWEIWQKPALISQVGDTAAANPGIRWDIMLGGIVGLILGFVLRVSEVPVTEILAEGIAAAARAAIWFLCLALFLLLACDPRTLRRGIFAGVAALLLNLCVSGGISQPSVSTLLWAMIAIGLSQTWPSLGTSPRSRSRDLGLRALMLPVTLTLLLLFLFNTFYPTLGGTAALGEVRQRAVGWHETIKPRWQQQLEAKGIKPERALEASQEANNYLISYIFPALHSGQKLDPDYADLYTEAAMWSMEQSELFPSVDEILAQALGQIRIAQRLDPDQREHYAMEARIHLVRAARFPKRTREAQAAAIKAFRSAVQCDPTDARLRYEFTDALFGASETNEGRRQAEITRNLTEQSATPERQLPDAQREQLSKWLSSAPPK